MTQSKNIKGNKKFLVSIRRDIQEVHIVYAKDKANASTKASKDTSDYSIQIREEVFHEHAEELPI
jgi:hypothetical protein